MRRPYQDSRRSGERAVPSDLQLGEKGDWTRPGFDAVAWPIAVEVAAPEGALRAQVVEPTRIVAHHLPVPAAR
jgi:acetamidase/formamidase